MFTKVSIVEDDGGVREHLEMLINGGNDLRCVSSHSSAEEALAKLPGIKPDVVLMDINLPGITGIECTRKLKEKLPSVQILMLTMYDDADQIFQSLTAGASGYLLKRTPPTKLLDDIQAVKNGASPMSPKVARKVVEYFQSRMPTPAAGGSGCENLSKREEEILDLLAKGYRYKEIADALGISFDTVRSHLRNIYEKLHVSSRTEAVVKYLGK
jgi:DNA-binding NarL/FixJ family response regulator